MQAALATIWLCVAIGTALGLSQRLGSRATEPIRSFAIVAAGLVALIVLLPHAVESEGAWGLVAGAGAFAAIPVVERLGTALFRNLPTRTVRREVSFVGLVVHRFADGVAMRVEGHGADVLFALGAHEIPIVALVMLAYLDRGVGTALSRVALLGVASTLGCVAVDALPNALGSLHGYADALAAGILWHIVVHELSEPAAAPPSRSLDVLGAVVAGVMLWLPSGDDPSHAALGTALLDWLLLSAPAAVLGLSVASALRAARPGAVRAAPAGAGARPATPEDVRPENVAVSFAVLGWPLAALRLAGAAVLALTIAFAERRAPPGTHEGPPRPPHPAQGTTFGERWWQAARRGSAPLMVWLVLGAIVAAYVGRFIPEGLLAERGWPEGLLAAAGVAVVARSSPIAATPIAAALMGKGLSPSAALAGLWLGAATSSVTIGALERALGTAGGRGAAAAFASAAVALCAALAMPRAPVLPGTTIPAYAWAFLAAMTLICSAAMLQTSVRGWLASGLRLRQAGPGSHAPEALELRAAGSAEASRDAGSL